MEPGLGVDANIQSQKPVDELLLEAQPISSVVIPETPVKEGEGTAKLKLDLKLMISSQVAAVCSEDDCNSHTPKEAVFDPFVKGSEHVEGSHGMMFSRRLDFELLDGGSGGKCDADPEKKSADNLLSENLLDTIVSEQANQLLLPSPDADDDELLLSAAAAAELFVLPAATDDAAATDDEDDELDGFKTPTTMASTSETCPAAPRGKRTWVKKVYMIQDVNVSRKLEFF